MDKPTRKQQQILNFMQKWHRDYGLMPTYQEIANHFGYRSLNSVTQHVRLLRKKGLLANEPGRARSFRVVSPLQVLRRQIVDIPLLGSIPAGFADRLEEEA